LADRKSRGNRAAAKAARDHEAIVNALHSLEKALASPAPGRETAWKRQAGAALVIVIDSLNAHRESSESEGGAIAEAESVFGQPPALAAARNQHARLLRGGSQLLTALEERADDPKLTVREVRQRAWRLASALRGHQALEADLILEAFDGDIGGEG
jgi:hypothetical protein